MKKNLIYPATFFSLLIATKTSVVPCWQDKASNLIENGASTVDTLASTQAPSKKGAMASSVSSLLNQN